MRNLVVAVVLALSITLSFADDCGTFPTDFCGGGAVKANPATINCTATCTQDECCDKPFCTNFTCQAYEDLITNAAITRCAGFNCAVTDGCCANRTCEYFGCAGSSTLKTAADNINCTTLPCTNAQCCNNPTCAGFSCTAPNTLKTNAATITCAGTTCTSTECCDTVPQCAPVGGRFNATLNACVCVPGYVGDGLTCVGSCAACFDGDAFIFGVGVQDFLVCANCLAQLTTDACAPCCPLLLAAAHNPCSSLWWYDYPSLSSGFTDPLMLINESLACGPLILNSSCGCNNGLTDSLETDTDCGGATCDPCPAAAKCTLPSDCQSGACTDGACAVDKKADTQLADILVAIVVIFSILFLILGVVGYIFWWSAAVQEDVKRKPNIHLEMQVRSPGPQSPSQYSAPKKAIRTEEEPEDVYVS